MSKAAIICVDDEAIILDSLKRQLRKAFENQYIYEFAPTGSSFHGRSSAQGRATQN